MTLSTINLIARSRSRARGVAGAIIALALLCASPAGAAGHRIRRLSARCSSHHSQRCSYSACPNATVVPTAVNIAQVDAATLCLINQQRELAGERPLIANAHLGRAATQHSQDIVTADYFAHVSPSGATPLSRIESSGFVPHGDAYELGENIGVGTALLATPAAMVLAWMNSPDHRANILDSDYADSGIGVVAQVPAQFSAGELGATYTEDFGVVEAP